MNAYYEMFDLLNRSFFIFLYALLGGLIPALFWLWFWMHEDNKHREPRKIILLVFLFGMLGVFVSFFFQKTIDFYFQPFIQYIDIKHHSILNLISVIIEEFVKYFAAYIIFFRTKLFNEPIDAFIYLMTAAIGFTAMENSLYLIQPLVSGQILDVIVNSNIRFIGASVLHVASSGLLALFIGFSFCKTPLVKELYVWFGLIIAIILHWIFNLVLIKSANSMIILFSSVWVIVIFLIISLEKVKVIKCDLTNT